MDDDGSPEIDRVPFLRRMKRRSRNSSSVHFDLATNEILCESPYASGGTTPTTPKYGRSPKFGSSPKFTISSTPPISKSPGAQVRRRSASENCKPVGNLKGNRFLGAGDFASVLEAGCGYWTVLSNTLSWERLPASELGS